MLRLQTGWSRQPLRTKAWGEHSNTQTKFLVSVLTCSPADIFNDHVSIFIAINFGRTEKVSVVPRGKLLVSDTSKLKVTHEKYFDAIQRLSGMSRSPNSPQSKILLVRKVFLKRRNIPSQMHCYNILLHAEMTNLYSNLSSEYFSE